MNQTDVIIIIATIITSVRHDRQKTDLVVIPNG